MQAEEPMPTHDFTRDGNFSRDPRRAEQLRLASTFDLDAIQVDVMGGPIGSHGFRSGLWTATHAGQTYRFHASIPHQADLAAQRRALQIEAARHIAGIASGYVQAQAD
jgi:hypothetical protein